MEFTVYHIFRTTINLRRQPKGFGIKGNRVTLRMADLIGLKDIDINVTGSHKPLTMINCFCRAIEEPETDQVKLFLLILIPQKFHRNVLI